MTEILGPDGNPASMREVDKKRPREQATEAFAQAISKLYPGHGFLIKRDEVQGKQEVIHFETPSALCGGKITMDKELVGGSPAMSCSKCGRIEWNLDKPGKIEMKDEDGRYAPLTPQLPDPYGAN